MKSRLLLFALYFSFHLYASEEEQAAQLANQAKAFADTRDFTRASLLYEELSKRPLPDWQQALILYDWGTVKLLQQQWQQALELFYRIPLSSLSSPLLLRSLTLNKAVAHLGQAHLLATLTHSSLEEQLYLTWQGLQELQEATTIDCRLQKMEQDSSSCVPSKDLTVLLKKALLTLDQIRQKRRFEYLASAAPSSLLSILKNSLDLFLKQLSTLEQIPSVEALPYIQVLLDESKTVFPVWNLLKTKTSHEETTKIEEALKGYYEAISYLEEQKIADARKNLQHVVQLIENRSTSTPWETLLLHYQFMRLTDINESAIQALIHEQARAVVDGSKQARVEKATGFLNTSLHAIQEGDFFKARFYILYSQSILESEEISKQASPLTILKYALQTAITTQQLTQLTHLTNHAQNVPDEELFSIIKKQQDEVIERASPFIPSLLDAEKIAFDSQKGSSCQSHPWDRIIPLFEKGYLAAKQAQLWIALQPLQALALFDQQKQTVKNWQEALKLLEQAASSSSAESEREHEPAERKERQKSSAKEDLNETLQMIQDMQSQDQPPKQRQAQQEGHSW